MSKIISIAEVRMHNHKDSVWMIIHNEVYDVTNFLDEHPGGEETLLEAAGKDSTQDFEDVGHSEDARELLKKYKIGTLPVEQYQTVPEPVVGTCCPRLPPGLPTTKESKTWRTFDHASPSSGSNLKWYILALVGAIIIGVVIKKKLAA